MKNNKIMSSLFLAAVSFNFIGILAAGPFDCEMCDYNIESLDIASFRPVQSLQEDVHERIVEFLADLQQEKVTIPIATQELNSLCVEIESRLDSSHLNTIRSEDRDYLLQMIDQIDELIASLEGNDDSRVVGLRESCSDLKSLFD